MLLLWAHDFYSYCGVAILASQHTNTTNTHPFTCDGDILAFEHASIAFQYNRKRITINRCVVQLNKQSFYILYYFLNKIFLRETLSFLLFDLRSSLLIGGRPTTPHLATKITGTLTWLRCECLTQCTIPVHAPQRRTQESEALSRTQDEAMYARES